MEKPGNNVITAQANEAVVTINMTNAVKTATEALAEPEVSLNRGKCVDTEVEGESKLDQPDNYSIIKRLFHNIQQLTYPPRRLEQTTQHGHNRKEHSVYQNLVKDILSHQRLKNNVATEKIHSPHATEADNCNSRVSHDSDSSESDGLQEFLDAVEPKKKERKRKPRRKRELTKEEEEAKARENLRRRTCEICGMVFSIPKGLQNHMRVKHTFEKPYCCDLCSEKFSVQSTFALHRRRHLGIKPHLCNVCGKNFLRNTDLRIHMRTHTNVRDIKCNLCSNTYNSMVNLKKHKLIKHTNPNEWKHECHICGKKCFSSTTLNLHVKQHNEDRSFKCHLCGKGFYTNQNMKVHILTHSTTTKFNCEHCPNGYRSNETLQRHLLKTHGIGKEKPPSHPKYFCPICNNGFLQKARFERHLRLHETGEEEYPYECEICSKRYKDRNFFALHMKNKHDVTISDDYFKIRFCNISEAAEPYSGKTFQSSVDDELDESS